ncbi:MAG: type II toxin-antitoxin system RelB/DinJ family antitoxin [Clostridiales Family XIII bacterium]|jgi:addiction module RelB/DinJ family antitoxin|nr:type II toxin-antitoxin system RelB/DinJ family antitoxin [Clostridiales Family XIII bacterium]
MDAVRKVSVNVKIDADIKQLGEQMLRSMGLDHTTFINMAYRELIREKQLPFLPKVPDYVTLETKMAEKMINSKASTVYLSEDDNGNIAYDPRANPELHDWVKNG